MIVDKYFSPIVLNTITYVPGILITPIRQETYNCNYNAIAPTNFNHFNGYNQLISTCHLGQVAMKNAIPHSPDLQNAYPEPEGELLSKENILDCLPKKSSKIESEEPTPTTGLGSESIEKENISDCLAKKSIKIKSEEPTLATELGDQSVSKENILDCLPKKSSKIESKEPTPATELGGQSISKENILDCLPKKSSKIESEEPTPTITAENNSQQASVELKEPIHCKICNETYKNNVALALHSAKHNEDGKYTCHFCNYKKASKYHIKRHIGIHEKLKYKCEICGKVFRVESRAVEHKYFHTGEKSFQCEICGKFFRYSSFLSKHLKCTHSEILTGSPLRFNCKLCNKHYATSSGLSRHKHKSHEKIDDSVLCDICGKRLTNRDGLKFHRRVHTGYKPFSCGVCPKASPRRSSS
ncbi:hypothetical protein NQ318_020900 [Aromia moschata]|uniref:C2H2-type domain-containing protein n=1 Tax=Aromia moschata TaxID=1265417 RepID=A0AAV8XXC8_9CUCU|nr:hypothetical protein NQ318_020900 [Aromia moschata]